MKRLKLHFSRHRYGRDNSRNEVQQRPTHPKTEASSSDVVDRQVAPSNPTTANALERPASDTKEPQPAQIVEKSQVKAGDAHKEGNRVSSTSATAAIDMVSMPTTATLASKLDEVSSATTTIAQPEEAVPCVAPLANGRPASPPSELLLSQPRPTLRLLLQIAT